MATSPLQKANDKIKLAEEKLKQAKALKQKIEAVEKTVEAKKSKANETRKKILAGSLILKLMETEASTKINFMQRMETYLTKQTDRDIFGFSEIVKNEQQS